MPATHTSDFEKLVQKCATDLAYRTSLADALRSDNYPEVKKLLTEIGVGHGGDRVNVLKAAYEPMVHVSDEFMRAGDLVPAP